jgi:hypothetical protein
MPMLIGQQLQVANRQLIREPLGIDARSPKLGHPPYPRTAISVTGAGLSLIAGTGRARLGSSEVNATVVRRRLMPSRCRRRT